MHMVYMVGDILAIESILLLGLIYNWWIILKTIFMISVLINGALFGNHRDALRHAVTNIKFPLQDFVKDVRIY